MKLTDLDVDLVQSALGEVRTAWINAAREENRRHTEVELVTMSILAAVQRVLLKAASEQKARDVREEIVRAGLIDRA